MENKNKKIVVPTIVAVLTLVMLTVGAAYAYFTVSTTNSFGTKTITATTPSVGSVALTSGTNLTMNVTASQMMAGNSDIIYYASENGTTTTETTETIGTATVTGEGTFSCDYTLTIDDNSNSLYDAFQSMSTKSAGQIVLSVNGVEYDFNTTNLFPKTISGTMNGLTSSNPKNITAQLKLVNKINVDQSALAGKTLNLSFNVSNFKCNATEEISGTDYVLATASSGDIWESTLEDDGIRFVGTNPDNYVCFGYDNAETDCDFTNATNSDKYAYRIIGIFEDSSGNQHLKLIKKEVLNTDYTWHDSQADVDWDESDLYKGLNGSYFLTNATYSYMQDDNWLNKVATWNYTATNTKEYDYYTETVRNIYLHELNKVSKNSTTGEWKTVSSKIGLIYVSDMVLTSGNVSLDTKYNASNNSWIMLGNNDSNVDLSYMEWSMTRQAINSYYTAWTLANDTTSSLGAFDIDFNGYVRPVFYLTSDVTITGEGTLNSPFIVS